MRTNPDREQIKIEIVGSSRFGRYKKISSEVTYNCYISDDWLVSFAGWKAKIALLPSGSGRGTFHSVRGNFIIAVVNSSVYRLDENLAPTFIGTIESAQGEVYMDENLNNQVCIVDGIRAYIYNWSGAPFLTAQTLDARLVPSYVCFHNNYFLFGNGITSNEGNLWFIYEYASATTIQVVTNLPLQTKPDSAIAIKRIPGQGSNVIVFGRSVCEIWTQVAGVRPYRKNESINVDYGCLNVTTIASCDEYIAWLGINETNAPVIMVYSQQGATVISTDGINHVLNNLVEPNKSTATFYKQDGHLFYQLTFYGSDDNLTLVYDVTTQKFFHLSDADTNYHPAIDVVYFNQRSYFLSLRNATLYELSTNLTTYDENISGEDPLLINEIPRIRICKSIRMANADQFVANRLSMMIEQGYDENYQGLNDNNPDLHYVPRVDLALSSDGGVTFGNYISRKMNPLGKRQNQMTWNKMGLYNDLTLKFKFWNMGHICVNNAYLDVG